jgi:hypothetical protein
MLRWLTPGQAHGQPGGWQAWSPGLEKCVIVREHSGITPRGKMEATGTTMTMKMASATTPGASRVLHRAAPTPTPRRGTPRGKMEATRSDPVTSLRHGLHQLAPV